MQSAGDRCQHYVAPFFQTFCQLKEVDPQPRATVVQGWKDTASLCQVIPAKEKKMGVLGWYEATGMASEDFGGRQVSGMHFAHEPEWAVLAEDRTHKINIYAPGTSQCELI